MRTAPMTEPSNKIAERLKNAETKPKVGDKVLVTKQDGTQYIGEIVKMHERIKNWIVEVQKVDDDGKVTIEEVGNLVVDAVIIVRDVVVSDIWKVIGQWFRNIFRKKDQKNGV